MPHVDRDAVRSSRTNQGAFRRLHRRAPGGGKGPRALAGGFRFSPLRHAPRSRADGEGARRAPRTRPAGPGEARRYRLDERSLHRRGSSTPGRVNRARDDHPCAFPRGERRAFRRRQGRRTEIDPGIPRPDRAILSIERDQGLMIILALLFVLFPTDAQAVMLAIPAAIAAASAAGAAAAGLAASTVMTVASIAWTVGSLI